MTSQHLCTRTCPQRLQHLQVQELTERRREQAAACAAWTTAPRATR